jgi:hypothetical protein
VVEIGSRERGQPAPPHVVWQSLAEPRRVGGRPWLELLDDEMEPAVLDATSPDLVVWSSIWLSRPHDLIRFDLRPAGSATALRWTVTTTGPAPDGSKAGHIRRRMNVLINEKLRYSYGQ